MIEILYSIFIYPIELFIKLVLESAYGVTGSYGLSIITVSLVISIILLPVYTLVERLQKSELLKRATMQPQLDDLKKSFKGYELHLYMNQVYREHNYRPISALKSSLGLMIQLPFLIAAYMFIANYDPLQGVSFCFIPDLSQPDSLMLISGLIINILPFLMTAVNIAGAYLYARNLNGQGGLQMYMIALAFLVLLYQAPSGVLLYWTSNNFFSFVKYLILFLRS